MQAPAPLRSTGEKFLQAENLSSEGASQACAAGSEPASRGALWEEDVLGADSDSPPESGVGAAFAAV